MKVWMLVVVGLVLYAGFEAWAAYVALERVSQALAIIRF